MENNSNTTASPQLSTAFEGNYDGVCTDFDSMGLKTELLRSIYTYGFRQPSTIQQRAIVPMISGKDIICQAQSGAGKTGAFCISILNRLDLSVRSSEPQALILCPTRELAIQSNNVISGLGQSLGLRSRCIIGGVARANDISYIREGVHVVVGTTGRVLELIERGDLSLKALKIVCVDEADQMLSTDFNNEIAGIFNNFPCDVQVMLVSATISPEVLEIANSFMQDPIRILVKAEDLTLQGINQYYINVEKDEWKLACLVDLYNSFSTSSTVIFCNSRARAETITETLIKNKHSVSTIHSDLTQAERNEVMGQFRSAVTRVLVTTDLIARGIDVQHVSLVINFDLPRDNATYLHRIGRSGRFGRKGVALNLVCDRDMRRLDEIQKFYDCQIEEVRSSIKELIH